MTRGRKPKPLLVKVAEGNRGKRKLPPVPPAPTGPFEPPFALDGAAKEEWDRILSEAPWLRASESMALADRCLCVQRMLEAEADIRQRGSVVRTRNGKVKNPSIQIARSYRISIQRYDVELGLTTSARTRLESSEGGMISAKLKAVDSLEEKLCG